MITVSLHVGAKVYCQDEYCGDLHTVVMNRAKGRITDLLVEPTPTTTTSPKGTGRASLLVRSRAVPVALTDYVDDRGVHLRIDVEELQTYPEGVEGLTQTDTVTD